jgi:hypothetical protein
MRITLDKFTDLQELNLPLTKQAEIASDRLLGLAGWVLSTDASAAIRLRPSVLPDIAGSTTVLFVWEGEWKQRLVDSGLFASAFVLPLCWKEGLPDSSALPNGFWTLIDDVRTTLAIDNFGLHLAECLGTSI